MKADTMPLRRRTRNALLTAAVWLAAALSAAITVGILALILVRGLPHLNWSLLTSVPSVIRKVDGILP